MKTINESISEIKKITDALDSVVLPATDIINRVDSDLSRNNPGVEHWYRIPISSNWVTHKGKRVTGTYILGYAREEKSRWCLMVRCWVPVIDEKGNEVLNSRAEYSSVPLSNASRELRIGAIQHLQAFLSELVDLTEQSSQAALNQVQRAKEAIDTIKSR